MWINSWCQWIDSGFIFLRHCPGNWISPLMNRFMFSMNRFTPKLLMNFLLNQFILPMNRIIVSSKEHCSSPSFQIYIFQKPANGRSATSAPITTAQLIDFYWIDSPILQWIDLCLHESIHWRYCGKFSPFSLAHLFLKPLYILIYCSLICKTDFENKTFSRLLKSRISCENHNVYLIFIV